MSATAPAGAPPFARLLVRLPNWLGDVLLARPLLHALRRAHPAAEIAAVAPPALLDLIALDGTVDRAEASGGGRDAGLLARLRAWSPEVALVLPPSFSSALFAWRTGARRRIGYRHEWRSFLLSESLPRPPRGDLHLSREYLALGARVGAGPVAVPALALGVAATEAARELRRAHGFGDGPYALLGPAASYGRAKRWAPDRFAAVGRALAARGMGVAVCGAGVERATVAEVARAVGPAAADLAGATALPLLGALCASASVVVCNDSGLAHLAAATGVPTVAVFGSTSSAWTAPLGPRVRVLQRPPVCSPCFRRTCRIGYRCLDAVAVADVLAAVAAA